MPIPIIDLFAGPGGLSEGFSSLHKGNSKQAFEIKLSIEMDQYAHRTLELRAFFRQFLRPDVPGDFYDYVAGKLTREDLFMRHKAAAAKAKNEAWHAELGGENTPASLVRERINNALNGAKKWVLIGGPPCQAYSLVGRSRVIGGEGREKHEADPRHHLYKHYLSILADHRPPVFVMENVKGLLSAKLNNESMFDRILSDLRHPVAATANGSKSDLEYHLFPLVPSSGELTGQYEPEDFVVRSEDFGIPQARHRLIIVGVRSDWNKRPDLLEKQSPQTRIEEVLRDLPKLRSGLSKESDTQEAWQEALRSAGAAGWLDDRKFDPEFRESLEVALKQVSRKLTRGAPFIAHAGKPAKFPRWYHDARLKGVCNHETRGHIREDLHRYFFAAMFAKQYRRSPLLEDFPKALLPNHENVAEALVSSKFNDRFRVQVKGRPSTTVVSHIHKDGHYFIHYDPVQCRSLTVREAARLQTFPDNYFFEGPRTQQYKQVGNAVPPLLAKQIAKIIHGMLD